MKTKKLTVARETLRRLDPADLAHVRGGWIRPPISWSCPQPAVSQGCPQTEAGIISVLIGL
jgi:hypothetical protein